MLDTTAGILVIDQIRNWLNTPDGRKGWASWLLEQGYIVYLIDQPARGRSPYHPSLGPTVTYSIELAERRWTACKDFHDYPQATLHTQWPGTGRMGDPAFDTYYATLLPSLTDFAKEQRLSQAVGAKLLDRIGPSIILSHSQGGTAGWLWADGRPELVKGIVAIEPSGPPFGSTIVKGKPSKIYGITDAPLTYDPPPADGETPLDTAEQSASDGAKFYLQKEPARKLVNLSKVPVMMVTGEASSHVEYDGFTCRFLQQAGVNVQHAHLADEGIHGNGHLMFLEMNNLVIIEFLEQWIAGISQAE